MPSSPDADLVSRSSHGDAFAFQMLYDRHWSAVYRYAWLLTSSVPDAEDITQECFLALIRRPSAFDPARCQLRTYLISIARYQHFHRRRAEVREETSVQGENPSPDSSVVDDLIRSERADAVRRAVEHLATPQREALYLFEFEGLSLADTAAILEIEPNAVKARLYRAREQLKRLLAPLRPDTTAGKEQSNAR